MRVGLLTEGGYPYATGEARVWCDRLVRGLADHEFDVYALSRDARQEAGGLLRLPPQVRRVRTAALWGEPEGRRRRALGRRERRRFREHFADLAAAVCGGDGMGAAAGARSAEDRSRAPRPRGRADRFADALYGLAELARTTRGLPTALRSEGAVRILESACRAPGVLNDVHGARLPDLLAVARALESVLRPLSLDWYGEEGEGAEGLAAADLCHAASGGAASLAGLMAKRFFGVPLLVTEYGVRLREHYLASSAASLGPPVRTLLASFQRQLAAEVYAQAALITPGNTHARRWQERCGAPPARLRTVYPGMDARPFAAVGDSADPLARKGPADARTAHGAGGAPDGRTLVWVGRIEPAKDLVALLHALAETRKAEPGTRLRVIGVPGRRPGPGAAAGRAALSRGVPGASEARGYEAHCRALAAQLFPDEADSPLSIGENPVSFEEVGGPGVPTLADAYAAADIVVLSSVVEGFPAGLVEAMLCGRATVSTDTGAVCEIIGGTGLVVPPRNPKALAHACVALLRDPGRRARLGAAARARALELFTVEQNIAAFRGIYLELMSRCPVRREEARPEGGPLPFTRPPEAHLPGHWAGGGGAEGKAGARRTPSWARPEGEGPARSPSPSPGALTPSPRRTGGRDETEAPRREADA